MNNDTSITRSRRWTTPIALLIGAVIFTVAFAGYAWQTGERNSKLDEGTAHASAASHLQDASAEGVIAGEFLTAYVNDGDESLIPRIQQHATSGVASLTQAIANSDAAELRQLALAGSGLAEGVGGVVALRQAGDIDGAAAALGELSSTFDAFGVTIQSAIDTELTEAASLANSSDDSGRTATWLLVTALSSAFASGAILLWVAARSLRRRRSPESPSPA